MKSIVLYASHVCNTKKIAEAIGDGPRSNGPVQVVPVEEAPERLLVETDLLIIGGPTEQHRMPESISQFFDRLAPDELRSVAAVAFDTRPRWPRWLSGSAAADITERLHRVGARVDAPAESFFQLCGATAPASLSPSPSQPAPGERWY